jgi:UDP-N-acetylglucosamine 4-epimerase
MEESNNTGEEDWKDVSMYEKVQERIRSRTRTWLVTGAAGFIGPHLLEALLKLDQRVIGLDNFPRGVETT